jgi:hypothetical protein
MCSVRVDLCTGCVCSVRSVRADLCAGHWQITGLKLGLLREYRYVYTRYVYLVVSSWSSRGFLLVFELMRGLWAGNTVMV